MPNVERDHEKGATHFSCNARLKKEGKDARCCECEPHGCGVMPKENWGDVTWVAERMHDIYEGASEKNGWKTQKQCRVPFKDLPDANKQTMMVVAAEIAAAFRAQLSEANDRWSKIMADMEEGSDAPMGVSAWRNHGRKYQYDKYFEDAIVKAMEGVPEAAKVEHYNPTFAWNACRAAVISAVEKVLRGE